MKILIIAAHPDDEVFGYGGAILKHIKIGDKVTILILTDGALTRYKKSMVKILRRQAFECAKELGVSNVIFENFPNQKLDTISITKIIQTIEKIIKKIDPDIVYAHDKGDLNHDHRIVYEATLVATRPIPGMKIKKLFTYFTPSSSEYNDLDQESAFVPNVFIDIKNEIEKKIKAASYYKTEIRPFPHPRSKEALKIYTKKWGIGVGIEYAEPFRLIREIKI